MFYCKVLSNRIHEYNLNAVNWNSSFESAMYENLIRTKIKTKAVTIAPVVVKKNPFPYNWKRKLNVLFTLIEKSGDTFTVQRYNLIGFIYRFVFFPVFCNRTEWVVKNLLCFQAQHFIWHVKSTFFLQIISKKLILEVCQQDG